MDASDGVERPGKRSVFRTVYFTGLGLLAVVAVAIRLAAPASVVAALATTVVVFAFLPALVLGARRVWRGLTYRVGVRLFISYVVIGLTPFALSACRRPSRP